MNRTRFRAGTLLFVDQCGHQFLAGDLHDLKEQLGGSGWTSKIFRREASGRVTHCGYKIGPHWLVVRAPSDAQIKGESTEFIPMSSLWAEAAALLSGWIGVALIVWGIHHAIN